MSRYIIKKDDKQLAYGFDHVLGYFYDITDLNEPDDSKDHLIESKSYFINGLSRGKFAEILEQWGARKTHLMAVALDQPL
jgi:hypothetical protein